MEVEYRGNVLDIVKYYVYGRYFFFGYFGRFSFKVKSID